MTSSRARMFSLFQASSAAVAASAACAVTVASLACSSAISADSSASASLARFWTPAIFLSNSARCADPEARSASNSCVDDCSCSRRSWILIVLPSSPRVSSALPSRSFSFAASAALSDAVKRCSTSAASCFVCRSSNSRSWRLASSAASRASASAKRSSESSNRLFHSAASPSAAATFSSATASCAAALASSAAASAAASSYVGPAWNPESARGPRALNGSAFLAGASGDSNLVVGRTTGLGNTLSIRLKSTTNLKPPTPAVRCMPVLVDGCCLPPPGLSGGLPPASDVAPGADAPAPAFGPRGVISSRSRRLRLSSTVVVLMSTVKLRPNGLFARFTRGRSGRGSHFSGFGASAIEALAAFSAAALSAASFSAAAFSAAAIAAASASAKSA